MTAPKNPDRGMPLFLKGELLKLVRNYSERDNISPKMDDIYKFVRDACAENFKAGQRKKNMKIIKKEDGFWLEIKNDNGNSALLFLGDTHGPIVTKVLEEEIRREVENGKD